MSQYMLVIQKYAKDFLLYFSEFGAETCNGVGSHYEVEQTTSTSSPTEMEKKLVEGHNNSPDLIQSTF